MQLTERGRPYAYAVLACVAVSLVSSVLLPFIAVGNVGMLFLLAVVLVAVRHGLGPAIFAAILAGLFFDFFFVYPPLGFALKDTQYLVTFAVMLVVGVITGNLTAGLRFQADTAARREKRAQVLSEFAREMSAAVDAQQVVDQAQRVLGALFDGQVVVMLPDAGGVLPVPPGSIDGLDMAIARHVFAENEPAGHATGQFASSSFHYIPLQAPGGVCGVLAMRPRNPRTLLTSGVQSELEAFARLVAIAVERIHFVDVAQDMRLRAASENLRNSMLAALSHDLRTPLASLVGLADALSMSSPPLSDARQAIVTDIRESAQHMSRLVNNLLDMARIQSGDIRLQREWHAIEETIGSALRLLRAQLAGRRVRVDIPADFPLVEFDALLIERVIANLVENAAKYSAADSDILVSVRKEGGDVFVAVSDLGCGLPADFDPFAKFVRGETGAATAGVGLGLAICRAFVEVHGGAIHAENLPQGGAVFTIRLPAGSPPDDGVDADVAATDSGADMGLVPVSVAERSA